jgi:hypothetical protein
MFVPGKHSFSDFLVSEKQAIVSISKNWIGVEELSPKMTKRTREVTDLELNFFLAVVVSVSGVMKNWSPEYALR